MFTLTGFDNPGGSGVLRTEYRIDGGAWTAGTTFTITTNGTHTIDFRSIDNVYNVEFYGTRTVRIDSIIPNSSISFIPHYGTDYVTKTTQFTISAMDNIGGSGIASSHFRIGVETFKLYTGPFTLANYTNGTYVIQYYAIDNVGNVGITGSITVKYDIEGPTVTIINPKNQTYGMNTINITLVSTAPDFNTSWYSIWYTSNNSLVISNRTWTTGRQETLNDGIYRIRAWGNDTYGNIKQAAIDVIFTIDTSIPIIVILSPLNTTYTNQALSVVIRNDSLCDYAAFRYSNGGPWSGNITLYYNGSYWVNNTQILADGHYQIQIFARYMSGLLFVGNEWFTIDTNAPVTLIDVAEEINILGTDYVNASSIISFSVIDMSVIVETRFWFDTSPIKRLYTEPFSLGTFGLPNGLRTIYYNSTDIVNHVEVTKSVVVYLDINPPTTSHGLIPAHSPDFVNLATPITLTAFDGLGESGIKQIFYRIGGSGAWSEYNAPFTLNSATNGTILIEYFSTDRANNKETTKSFTVRLDTNPPTTTPFYSIYPPNFVSGSTVFTLSATDAGTGESGVATSFYNYGTGWIPGNSFTLASRPNGTIMVQYYSVDNVGNAETPKSFTVRLDTIAPTTNVSYTPAYGINFVTTSTIFTVAASDNSGGSGSANSYYNINGTGWNTGNSFTLASSGLGNGTIIIQYYTMDNVGNVETTKSITVRLDMIAPNTTISYTPYPP
ncbi:MAG: hypothetical protein Q6370_000130, partial [Candidatus Sigynarchaeota archaeon]